MSYTEQLKARSQAKVRETVLFSFWMELDQLKFYAEQRGIELDENMTVLLALKKVYG
jgi:hypothetical protein